MLCLTILDFFLLGFSLTPTDIVVRCGTDTLNGFIFFKKNLFKKKSTNV